MHNLLQLESISVSLANKGQNISILDQISLDIPKGKMVAIVGPSGSGKTTLLMAAAGLIPIKSGRILFNGTALPLGQEKMMTAWRQRSAGIIFQNFHLLPSQTALENVAISLELRGEEHVWDKARDTLVQLGLGHRLDHLPGALSGGEQQRVALGRAIVGTPPLLLADEPTGNLDQENGHHVMELLKQQVTKNNTTLMLITHDPDLAAQCDMQVHILDGSIKSITGQL